MAPGSTPLLLLQAFCLLVGSSRVALTPSETFAGSASLVDNDIYHLFWKYNTTTITFEVHAQVLGWVGFGISPNGGMAGSDIVIGWVMDGVPYFHDRYATGDTMPTIDTNQDWTLLSASETATHTVLKLTRPLSLCDADDRSITADTMRIIFAYSNTDPSSVDGVTYHNSNRGAKSMMFMTLTSETAPSLPADTFYIDYVNNNVTIPHTSDTTYWCKGAKAPKIIGKNHLIRVDSIIQAGNEAHVHHILLYTCFHTPANLTDYPDEFVCFTPNMPWGECYAPIVGWAIGGSSFSLPAHVGMPFGEVSVNQILHLRMETHYDNPTLRQGVVNSSGLRLWFTPTLRTFDAGLIEAGIVVNPLGHCSKECLGEAMGTTAEIKVFAAGLHTHLLGTGVRVHHYRNGVEQPYLAEDLSYDFNLQETRIISPEVTIAKGDNLVVECTYKTSDKTSTTYAGPGTTDEMCLAFLVYYPAINVTMCESMPTQSSMASRMSLNHVPYNMYSDNPWGQVALLTDHSNESFHTYLGTVGQFTNQTTKDKYQNAILNGQIQHLYSFAKSLDLSPNGRTTDVPTVTSAYSAPCSCGNCSGAANIRSSSLAVLGLLSMLLIMASNM